MANRPLLVDADVRMLEKARRLRNKLSNKALAARLSAKYGKPISITTVVRAMTGNTVSVEEWTDKRAPAREQRRIARLRSPFRRGSEHRAIGARGFI
jgi:hypothetical protein